MADCNATQRNLPWLFWKPQAGGNFWSLLLLRECASSLT